MQKETKLEKLVEKIIETLVVGLVVGFFIFVYNQSKKVDKVDSKVETQSLVNKQLIKDLAETKALVATLQNEIRMSDMRIPPVSAQAFQEQIQQNIDKEIYRSQELKR